MLFEALGAAREVSGVKRREVSDRSVKNDVERSDFMMRRESLAGAWVDTSLRSREAGNLKNRKLEILRYL